MEVSWRDNRGDGIDRVEEEEEEEKEEKEKKPILAPRAAPPLARPAAKNDRQC